MTMNPVILLVIILVWLISGIAGISFLRQAARVNSQINPKSWWRKYLRSVHLRFLFVLGVLLIVWVFVSVFWVLMNYRIF